MPKANRKCQYCGKEYYACASCIGIYSYKNVCCSVDCYTNLFTNNGTISAPIEINEGDTEMQGILKNNTKIQIIGYDLENSKFDCADGTTRTGIEFNGFLLTLEELKALSNQK